MITSDNKVENLHEIKAEKLLIITDVHQNINWIKNILETEKNNYDHLLFNGDWIDSYYEPPVIAGSVETAQFVLAAINGEYGPASFNIGNHDLPVMESWKKNSVYSNKLQLLNPCSGFTRSKSMNFNKVLKWSDWRKFHGFHTFGGYVISHAGISSLYWRSHLNVQDNLNKIWNEIEQALDLISLQPSHWFAAGFARGGSEVVGGPMWLDWNQEFMDNLPIKQIVGHTTQSNIVRTIGRSYCIDANQTAYALLSADGKIEIKSTVTEKLQILDDSWKKQPIIQNDKNGNR